MYAGKKVEEASVDDDLADPRHPYTRGLMASMPAVISLGGKTDVRLTGSRHAPSLVNLPSGLRSCAALRPLAIDRCRQNIRRCGFRRGIIAPPAGARQSWRRYYERHSPPARGEGPRQALRVRGGVLRRQVGTVHAGRRQFFTGRRRNARSGRRTGCGKSTAVRCCGWSSDQRQHQAQRHRHYAAEQERIALVRRSMQIVFQDPFAAQPRMTAGDIVGEPLSVHGLPAATPKRRASPSCFVKSVTSDQMKNFPHQFSGGQRQRICIARASRSASS